MADDGAVVGRDDPLGLIRNGIDPAEWLKDAERRRQEQIRRIRSWENVPIYSIYRRNPTLYERTLKIMEADLRLIEHGIKLVKAGKGA